MSFLLLLTFSALWCNSRWILKDFCLVFLHIYSSIVIAPLSSFTLLNSFHIKFYSSLILSCIVPREVLSRKLIVLGLFLIHWKRAEWFMPVRYEHWVYFWGGDLCFFFFLLYASIKLLTYPRSQKCRNIDKWREMTMNSECAAWYVIRTYILSPTHYTPHYNLTQNACHSNYLN